jgi:lipopolysaccharide transport system ATP-binding protein
MLKDRNGQYLFAEGTDRPLRAKNITLRKASAVKSIFSFDMPIIIRGEYTLNLAFAEGPGDDHIQHHWLHDAIAITVTGNRLVHGIAGMHNMKMSLEIN